jgi:hypothetical protein
VKRAVIYATGIGPSHAKGKSSCHLERFFISNTSQGIPTKKAVFVFFFAQVEKEKLR